MTPVGLIRTRVSMNDLSVMGAKDDSENPVPADTTV